MRDLLLFFVSPFSIVNPLSVIPTFMGLTHDAARSELRRITRQASFPVFLILMASYTAGEAVLGFFSISVGLILAAIAVEFITSGLLDIFPGWAAGAEP